MKRASRAGQRQQPDLDKQAVLADYRLAWESRHASLIGRKEVLTGKAKFGIFGDGKEVAQIALAKVFEKGDFRSGYYRDQTLMFALGISSLEGFFAQLYADPDPAREPASAGRQMNCHFSTALLAEDGSWLPQIERYNSASDLSPIASQMPRLVGLAYASRLYRELPALAARAGFSRKGNEIAFGTIGNASCAEGLFWESLNAVGVLRSPMLLSIWDDGYGISVPNDIQLAKPDLSMLLEGFSFDAKSGRGMRLYRVAGWDYPALVRTYREAAPLVRATHVPAIVHVTDLTQPQGHSTSGSHERYKPSARLSWERDHDCLSRMRGFLIQQGIAVAGELDEIEAEALKRVRDVQRTSWRAFSADLEAELAQVVGLVERLSSKSAHKAELSLLLERLRKAPVALRRNTQTALADVLRVTRGEPSPARSELIAWRDAQRPLDTRRYDSHLYPETARSAQAVQGVAAAYADPVEELNGYEILNRAFDSILKTRPEVLAFGEDVGRLGDVNQGFAGLQAKHGELRVGDTGIREATIVGQAIGLALRGLRPIAEIQYLDYLLYALQILSDDLASLSYRTRGRQCAPVIIRTRGHRLEGIWHSGSPLGGILNLVRGMCVLVPRNMTQAAGFYQTMLESDDSAIVVEVLNGYRLKERLPSNLAALRVPLGIPEVLREGSDVTLVTYGACCRVALEAAEKLEQVGIETEVLDVQCLLPFDREARIRRSLEKTSRVVFVDEDVPGGATAYMLREVLETQGGYEWLDSPPRTLTGSAHRPAYGSDGDYWSKPGVEQIFESVYTLMHEAKPKRYPLFDR